MSADYVGADVDIAIQDEKARQEAEAAAAAAAAKKIQDAAKARRNKIIIGCVLGAVAGLAVIGGIVALHVRAKRRNEPDVDTRPVRTADDAERNRATRGQQGLVSIMNVLRVSDKDQDAVLNTPLAYAARHNIDLAGISPANYSSEIVRQLSAE